jgi:hypothetical protein
VNVHERNPTGSLQRTPYDAVATIRVWALLDDFTKALCLALKIKPVNKAMEKKGLDWISSHPQCKFNTPHHVTSDDESDDNPAEDCDHDHEASAAAAACACARASEKKKPTDKSQSGQRAREHVSAAVASVAVAAGMRIQPRASK